MKKEKISHIIGMIDEKHVDEAAGSPEQQDSSDDSAVKDPGPRRSRPFGWAIAAACLTVMIGIGSVTFGWAAEAKEYRDAEDFFEMNGLSAQGLSRAEVKAVYRDITANSFTYDKTAEVMRRSLSGWEIRQDEPTPEELAAVWDKNVWMKSQPQSGIRYRTDARYVFDERRGFDVFDKSIFECYRDGDLLWSAEFTAFYVEGYSYVGGVTAVWGRSETFSSADITRAWIAVVDENGNVMWQRCLSHGFRHEYVGSVLRNGDGTWAVISRGDLRYLCLSCLDRDGNEQSFHQTEVGNLGIWNAARLGDGYIVQLGNTTTHDTALLYRMDREGSVTSSFSYEADDCEYHITDMIGYEGQVYLSAYAVPKQDDEGGRHEIANVLDYVFAREDQGIGISGEELTPVVRDNYTAVLLVCDPEGGVPKTFYSVSGSLGGRLSVNDAGFLEWDAESIRSTFFSPATSSFTIGGTCKIYRYTFDAEGVLIGRTDTGETEAYRR